MRGGLARSAMRQKQHPELAIRPEVKRATATSITVLLADEHAAVREGLRTLLHTQPDIRVVAEACTFAQAVHAARRKCPHVAIVDIALRGGGLEAARRISEICSATQVIILSMHANRAYILDALHMGACGYLLKEMVGAEVVEAVRTVHGGRRYLSPGADVLDEE